MIRVIAVVLVLVVASGSDRAKLDETGLVANVSMLLANYFSVDCIQIFRSNILPFNKMETIHGTWKKLAIVKTGVTTGVYSFERYIARRVVKKRKVSCYRSLKIVVDDEDSRRGYANLTYKYAIKDAVWVLFLKSFSTHFFELANVMFDDVIVIAVIEAGDRIVFYEIYRINQNLPLKVFALGNWTMDQGLTLNEVSFYDRRSDLEGIALKTASIEDWPATYVNNGEWDGFLIKVWKEIQSLINCTSINIRSEDDLIGMQMENGSWNGLVGMTLRNEIDVLVAEVVVDKERSHALKFLHPVVKSRFRIYTRHLGYMWQWDAVLKPFHVSVWLAALAWVLLITTFLSFTYNLCLSHGLEPTQLEKAFTPFKSFSFVLQALCQQGYHIIPNSYSCRILFFVSYAVSGVLIPSYSASLVSSLAQKKNYKSFDSLQEMVADGTYRLLVQDNSAGHAFFVHTKDEFLLNAYEKLAKPVSDDYKKMSLSNSINTICQIQKYALLGIEEIIDVRMHKKLKPSCTIVPISNPLSTIHMTMATARSSPFWGLINHHLYRLLINGVVARLKYSEFPHFDPIITDTEKEVGLRQLISAFVFIGFFTFLSVFFLLLEIQHHLYTTERNRLKRKKHIIRQNQAKMNFASDFEIKWLRDLPSTSRK